MKKLPLLLLFAISACGGGADEAGGPKNPGDVKTTEGAAQPAAITQFAKRDDSLKVDKIGPANGQLKPDGKNDAAFDVTLRGPVVALLIDAADESQWQWDTYTGTSDVPVAMKAFAPGGAMTGEIGVFENDKALNNADGSCQIKDAAEHHLVVYVADTGAFTPGAKFKILAETPDHKVIEGPTLTY